ncbi:cupin domain-containing protein [Membranicola marinus]|uniref:Cupin domain-containing protein n=1 Tax=Membranihabitans marinus TaxID=1227546 RepID=A0A953HQ53_9BACT|nr:cupin domain-containing protein [Membranihabitans marinus]MBY5960144.1 cupin domain-containing protein [Membranihabitans marinus]
MKKKWNFIQHDDQLFEKVDDRSHYWHSHPTLNENADSYMVKVIIKAGDGHDFHVHPEMHEILYVLRGKAEQWIEDEMRILEAGDSVYIDANVVHGTFNAGEEDLEFLAILSPSQGWEAGTVDRSGEEPYRSYKLKA